MDAIYYITSFLTILGIPALIALIILLLIKPRLANKHPRIKNPVSRRKIATIGLTSIVVATMSFGSVLAATEPANVKAERLAREAAEAKNLQIKQENEKKQAADLARKQADEQKRREEEANKPIAKTETKVEPVPFEAVERNDNSLPVGQKKLTVAGVNGERTITYTVTYIKGKETARSETKNEITKVPVTQVVLNGTYAKPAPAPVAPAPAPQYNYAPQTSGGRTGATCRDGSHSNATGSGACSHHGGVAQWLY